jgi:AraC-like DNA-binding protein
MFEIRATTRPDSVSGLLTDCESSIEAMAGCALDHAQERLARLVAGAYEELNRLDHIARQVRYQIVLCDAGGAALDLRSKSNTPGVDDGDEPIRRLRCASPLLPEACDRSGGGKATTNRVADGANVIDFGAHYRGRRGGLSAVAAPIFDADGVLIGTLDLCSMDQHEPVRPDALTRVILQTTARAIEERAFRERYRKDWVVAVAPAGEWCQAMLFAVDGQQNILAADRTGRRMLADMVDENGTPAIGRSFWHLFERNPSLFRSKDRGDITAFLVPSGVSETWPALLTPPERNPVSWCNADGSIHLRPRLGAIADTHQLSLAPEARGALSPAALRRVREHIDTHLETTVDIANLAAIARLSPSHFARAFKLSVGTTPHEYLIHQRLKKAQALMARTDVPLAEIALATGFSDQSHLSRRFRNHFGISPSAFRRLWR